MPAERGRMFIIPLRRKKLPQLYPALNTAIATGGKLARQTGATKAHELKFKH